MVPVLWSLVQISPDGFRLVALHCQNLNANPTVVLLGAGTEIKTGAI